MQRTRTLRDRRSSQSSSFHRTRPSLRSRYAATLVYLSNESDVAAYIDPGNWATDLQAGAEYGYKLLFVVLIASLSAVGTSVPPSKAISASDSLALPIFGFSHLLTLLPACFEDLTLTPWTHALTPVLQTLAVRLGVTTASSLPHETRKLFLRLEAKYPKYRVALHCGLWALYILAEIAIIATDLAELLGSAIALNL